MVLNGGNYITIVEVSSSRNVQAAANGLKWRQLHHPTSPQTPLLQGEGL